MKSFIREYQNVIIYTICGVLLVLGSYNILINVNHASYLSKKIMVSDIDNEYNHQVEMEYLNDEKCSKIITDFFSCKR